MPTSGDYVYEVSGSNATITGYTGLGGDITIPTTLDGYTVTSIGDGAFEGCHSLTNVTIPNSVTSIDRFAFAECYNLTNVTIPNSVASIGDSAFYYCFSLTSVTIPNSIISISFGTFFKCSSLTNVIIPNSVTSIGNGAFNGCSSLTSVNIPASITSIGDSAFADCSSLVIANFFGDAPPTIGTDVFFNVSPEFTIYYLVGATGFDVLPWTSYTRISGYSITYDGNGNTSGTVPAASIHPSGDTITVLGNTGNLVKTDYEFVGWNTKADGTGKDYGAGATFVMGTANVILYAHWVKIGFFKQFSIEEFLTIPEQKPCAEEILNCLVDVEIKSIRIIKTPKGKSIEGQVLTGYKAVITGKLLQKIEYVADEPTQKVHVAHFINPFSTFITLCENYTMDKIVTVNPVVEDVFFKLLDKRSIFKNITLYLEANYN